MWWKDHDWLGSLSHPDTAVSLGKRWDMSSHYSASYSLYDIIHSVEENVNILIWWKHQQECTNSNSHPFRFSELNEIGIGIRSSKITNFAHI